VEYRGCGKAGQGARLHNSLQSDIFATHALARGPGFVHNTGFTFDQDTKQHLHTRTARHPMYWQPYRWMAAAADVCCRVASPPPGTGG